MDAALADQIRAYERWLARTEARAELHAHQRAAWTAHLALARTCRDAAEHTSRLGASHAEAIAPWLDRQAALARIHRAQDDLRRADAHTAALTVTGDPIAHMIAHETRLRMLAADADTAGATVGGIVLSLLDLRAHRDVADQARYLAAQLSRLASLGISWASAFDLPLRHRLPFDRARFDLLSSWLPLPPPVPLPVPLPLPDPIAISSSPSSSSTSPAPLLASFHAQLSHASPATRPILEAILALGASATTGPDLLARLAETPLELELSRATHLATTADDLARAAERGQPHLAAHARARLAALHAATTPTEVEIAVAHSDACFAIESTWWSVLVHTATHATAAAALIDREDIAAHRAAAAAAIASTHALLGADFATLAHTTWLAPIVERVLHRLGDTVDLAPPMRLGRLGEVGYPVVAPLRAAAAYGLAREMTAAPPDPIELAARLTRPRLPTPAAFRDHLAALLAKAGAPTTSPDPARRVVRLWDHAIDVIDLDAGAAIALRPAY